MSIELDPRRESALQEAARKKGKDASQILAELVDQFVARTNGPESNESDASDPAYAPARTELGRALRALSRKHVESGGKLYSRDEINHEIAEGRGER